MIAARFWSGRPLPDGWVIHISVERARRGRFTVSVHVSSPVGVVTSDSVEVDAGALMPVSPLYLYPPVVIGLVDQVLMEAGLAAQETP